MFYITYIPIQEYMLWNKKNVKLWTWVCVGYPHTMCLSVGFSHRVVCLSSSPSGCASPCDCVYLFIFYIPSGCASPCDCVYLFIFYLPSGCASTWRASECREWRPWHTSGWCCCPCWWTSPALPAPPCWALRGMYNSFYLFKNVWKCLMFEKCYNSCIFT